MSIPQNECSANEYVRKVMAKFKEGYNVFPVYAGNK